MRQTLLQLQLARGIGNKSILRFLTYAYEFGSDELKAVCRSEQTLCTSGLLPKKPGRGAEELAANIIGAKEEALKIEQRLQAMHIDMLWLGHEQYPWQLLSFYEEDVPPILFVKGKQSLLHTASVALSGERDTSQKGLHIASLCASALIEAKLCLVCGCTQDIDVAVLQTVLTQHGQAIVYVHEGLLACTLRTELKGLLQSENVLLVSTTLPTQSMTKTHFFDVTGLARAFLGIEVGLSDESMLFKAMEFALARKQPCFVVEFANPAPSAFGNSVLLSVGAIPIRSKEGKPNLHGLTQHVLSTPQTQRSAEQVWQVLRAKISTRFSRQQSRSEQSTLTQDACDGIQPSPQRSEKGVLRTPARASLAAQTKLRISLDADLFQHISIKANACGMTLTEYCKQALLDYDPKSMPGKKHE